MTWLNDRLDHLGDRLAMVNGETVELSDNFDNPTLLLELSGVSRGRTEGDEVSGSGLTVHIYLIDFFVYTHQMYRGASMVVPRHNYKIRDRNGVIYKVVSGPADAPPWNYTTPSKKRMRIHTVEYKTP